MSSAFLMVMVMGRDYPIGAVRTPWLRLKTIGVACAQARG
jgi:hypothetical protein